MKLVDAIDNVFSHNEVLSIWMKVDEHDSTLMWGGMAWDLPEQYKLVDKWRIFGLIPDSIMYADAINIRILDGDEQ